MKLLLGILITVGVLVYEAMQKRAKLQRAKEAEAARMDAMLREAEEEARREMSSTASERLERRIVNLTEEEPQRAESASFVSGISDFEEQGILFESVESHPSVESAPALDRAGEYERQQAYDFSGQMEGRWQAAVSEDASEQPEMHPEVETFEDVAEPSTRFRINLRDAILYDAILNPPYTRARMLRMGRRAV